MKSLRCLMVLFFITIMTTSLYASGEKKVTINLEKVPIEHFLIEIRKQTGVKFQYFPTMFSSIGRVSVKAKDEPWNEVLKRVLSYYDMNFVVSEDNKTVIIRSNKPLRSNYKISGLVLDEEEQPLMGANVAIIGKGGTVNHTITDLEGKFSYNSSTENVHLEITFVGYDKYKKDLNLKNKQKFTFKMSSINLLDELVVTGYQTIDKRKLTSSISSITEKDLNVKGALTVDQLLEGKIPGLMSLTSSATPGASAKMRLRGSSTFTGSREPLWVIDGIIYENPVPLSADQINSWDNVNLIGNAITGLNPQDIARIDVLKDASATAIYGTRAANGVIVVTTKTGQAGHTKVNYTFNAQMQRRPRYSDYELMTSKERIDVSREIMDKGLYFENTPERYGYEGAFMDYWDKKIDFNEFQNQVSAMESNNTDWFGTLYRNSFSQSHNVSFSGGDTNTKYYMSLGYNNEKGAEKGADLQRFTARMNLTTHLRDNISLDVRMNGSVQDANYNSSDYSVFNESYYTSRIFPVYDQDGSYHYIQKYIATDQTTQTKLYGNYNILNELSNSGQNVKNKSFNVTAAFNWELLPNLRYSTTAGFTTTTNLSENWEGGNTFYVAKLRGYDSEMPRTDYNSISLIPEGGLWANSSVNQYSYVWRNQLNYNFDLNKVHHFNIDLGHEMSSVKYRGASAGPFPGYSQEQGESFIGIFATSAENCQAYYWYLRQWFMDTGTGKATSFPKITDRLDNKLSFYLTSTYTYKNYYSLNFNLRNDGSNRFGQYESEKFNPVWSLSGRLNLHELPFMEKSQDVNMLSLRASYGYRGSVPSATPYLIISTPKKNSVTGEMGSDIESYPNASLRWEKTSTFDFGLEYAFFKNRLTGGFDLYYSKSTDLISPRATSLVNGTPTLMYNDGQAENKGIEFSLSTVNISTRDFKWRTSVSFSRNKNKVKQGSLQENTYLDYLNGTVYREGGEVDGFYSYQFDGLDEKGLPRFKGLTGNEEGLNRREFLDKVMVYSGSRTPRAFGSFSTEVSWKDFIFRAEFSYKLDYAVRLLQLYQDGRNALPTPDQNMSSAFVNRWRNPGDEAFTNIPALTNVELSFPEKTISVPEAQQYKYTMVDLAYRDFAGPIVNSGWFMYDHSDARVAKGDHIRLRSITLGYTIPEKIVKKMSLGSIRVDLQAQNLGVWAFDKKLKGQDPDQVSSIGIPALPSFNLSINVGL